MMNSKILLTDDHRLLRQGLASLLQTEGFEVVGEAEDGRNAVKLAKKLRPDIVILDISMPSLNGIEATRLICQELPRMKVLMLSMYSDSRFILEAFKAGAAGYLLKDAAFEEMVTAVKTVLKGRMYLSPAIAEVVVRKSVGQWSGETKIRDAEISSRQREVLQLLAEGKSTKDIASTLYVSVKTVETHRKQIMDKLRVHSIAELTKYAIREGFTSL
jgi:DNA-binding NarL/FixJ family response regulator